jgi:energy-coupling factor transport system ATP-binding protein
MKLFIDQLHIDKDGQGYGPYTACFPKLDRVVVLGGTNSGKSILAETLSGIIPLFAPAKVEGRIVLDGIDQGSLPFGDRRHNFGFVFADPEAMMCTLRVKSELAFELENIGIAPVEIERRVVSGAAAIGISHLLDRQIDSLSGGQMQRLALATMLVTGARIISYDDPLKNLDPTGREEFALVIDEAREKRGVSSVVFTSQLHEDWYTYDIYCVQDRQELRLMNGCSEWIDFVASIDFHEHPIIIPAELAIICRLKTRCPTTFEAVEISRHAGVIWPDMPHLRTAIENARPRFEDQIVDDKIRFDAVTYQYPTTGAGIDKISGVINGPGITAIIGPNGAGKTTLAKVLTGLLSPDYGAIEIDGESIRVGDIRELSSRISYVFQEPRHQFVTDSVADEILFGISATTEESAEQKLKRIAGFIGLSDELQVHPYRLSPSAQRLLSLGAALAADRSILIIDEPTYGLDFLGLQRMKQILRDLKDLGKTILLISHDLDFLADLATWCLSLENGKVKFNGPLALISDDGTAGRWPTSRNFLCNGGLSNPNDWFVPPSVILSALDQL